MPRDVIHMGQKEWEDIVKHDAAAAQRKQDALPLLTEQEKGLVKRGLVRISNATRLYDLAYALGVEIVRVQGRLDNNKQVNLRSFDWVPAWLFAVFYIEFTHPAWSDSIALIHFVEVGKKYLNDGEKKIAIIGEYLLSKPAARHFIREAMNHNLKQVKDANASPTLQTKYSDNG